MGRLYIFNQINWGKMKEKNSQISELEKNRGTVDRRGFRRDGDEHDLGVIMRGFVCVGEGGGWECESDQPPLFCLKRRLNEPHLAGTNQI